MFTYPLQISIVRLSYSRTIRHLIPVVTVLCLLAAASSPSHAQQLDGVLMSGSGEGGFWSRNISLYNPDPERLYNVSVTPHLGQSTISNTDTLSGLVVGAHHGAARTSSWNPSLSKSGRMAFVVDWFWENTLVYHIVSQNRDATDRVVIAGPYHSGGAGTGGGPDRSYRPSVSPDGETVILAAFRMTNVDGGRQETGQLFRMPSDGSAAPELFEINDPNGCNEVIQAVYHPDRDEIAFLGYAMRSHVGLGDLCTPAVRVMDADGSNLRDVYVESDYGYNRYHIGFQLIDWKADRILFAQASESSSSLNPPRFNVLVVDDTSGEVVGSHPAVADHLIRSSFQLSPDARHIAYALNPDGQCWITAKDLETGDVVLDLTGVADTGQYCYMTWADAPAVPEPARLELSETELILWNNKSVQVLPTLYDVDGNVIVHEVTKWTGTVRSTQFRVNRLKHMYFGWTTNSGRFVEQCFLNAGLETCFSVWNAEAPVFSIEALTDTLYEATGEPGYVRITRFGNPRGMNVNFSNTFGPARPYRDFLMDPAGTSLAFAEGVHERIVRLTPIENGVVTNNQRLGIRLADGTGYAVNTTIPRVVNIPIIDSGVSSTSLAVAGVSPVRGGDRGTVELRAVGRGFAANAQLYLERGGARIDVTDGEVDSRFGQSSISGRADLRNGSLGLWDVVVESGGNRVVLPGAFEIIESPAEPIIYSSVIGPRTVSMREWGHRYRINIRNGGDTDIYDVMAHIWTHRESTAVLERGVAEFDDADYDASAPMFVDRGDYQIAPIWIYRLPANESVEVTVHIVNPPELAGQDLLVGVTHNTPDPDNPFTWTGVLDEAEEVLPWNLGVLLGRFAHFAQEIGAGKVACGSPPVPPGEPPGCDGFGSSTAGGNQADDAFNLAMSLQNDRARFFRATAEIPKYGLQKAVTSVPRRFTAGEFVGGCILNQVIGSFTGYRSDAEFAASLGFGAGSGSGGSSGGSGGASGGGSMCPPIVFSWDPNDKLSLAGEGEGRHISTIAEMPYQIRFENVDSASAPAQVVVITDTLDLAVFDVNTFRLGTIEIADEVIAEPPHGVTSFTTIIDRRPESDHRIHIHAALERDDYRNFARVVWTLTTLDPDADELPNEAMEGFLPPNKTAPEGEGSVRFYIHPHNNLPHGREISNHAEIVFDSNEPILTPVWTNTLDFMPPSSAVVAVKETETEGMWEVEWDGSDSGAGIRDYGIFVQKDGGPFELWAVSREGSAIFEGDPGAEYGFFAMSVDWVGNVEEPKTQAEMSTAVSIDGPGDLPTVYALHGNYPNPFNRNTIVPFDLPEPAHVRLQVFDMLGREVARVVDGDMTAGRHAITFDASRLASGTYFIRIDAGEYSGTRQMMVVR